MVILGLGLVLSTAGCVAPFAGDSTPTSTPTATAADATPSATEATPRAAPTATPIHRDYAQTRVRVVDGGSGAELGAVDAAIADTSSLRFTGLSETDDLPSDRGMLFVYEDPQSELTYVMRNMSFPLDIVFVHANGTIQSIHHVRAPDPGENGETIRASGRGQYVLEVNRGWTTERGVEAGDRVDFELPA